MKYLVKLVNKYKILPNGVKASLWFLLCSFLQKGISVITTPIFTRILTTAQYGQYSVFSSWMGIIAVFISMNLYSGVYVQGLVKFDDERNEFSSSLQGLLLSLTILWTIVYLVFHDFWNSLFGLSTSQMLAMLLLIWTSSVFNFWSQEQRVDLKYTKLVALTISSSFLSVIVSIVFVFFSDDKVLARILGMVLVNLIAYSGLFFAQMRKCRKFYSSKFWKYALLFNLPLIPHYLSMTVLNSADRIMIGRMVGSSEAGIYNLAYSLSQIMTIFNTALLQTIEPWMYKKIKQKQVKDISRIAYPTFTIIAIVNILLIALAPEAVKIFAPTEFYDAIYVIPPVALSGFFMFLYTFFAVFEFYYEKTKFVMCATILGACLNIILNYICINQFGYIASGYTTLVCYILFAICHYFFMQRLCNQFLNSIRVYNQKKIIMMSVTFIGIGFLFLTTYEFSVLRYVILILCFIIAFIMRVKIKRAVTNLIQIRR